MEDSKRYLVVGVNLFDPGTTRARRIALKRKNSNKGGETIKGGRKTELSQEEFVCRCCQCGKAINPSESKTFGNKCKECYTLMTEALCHKKLPKKGLP